MDGREAVERTLRRRWQAVKQLDLLTIRKQPNGKPLEIPSKTIRAFVRDRLRGFSERQAAREQRRNQLTLTSVRAKKNRQKKEFSSMRNIKVSFRAVFEQPIGALNPMGLKLPGPVAVELSKTGAMWTAYSIASAKRQPFDKLYKFTGLEGGKNNVQSSFKTMLQPWQPWGKPPGEFVERPLEAWEFQALTGAHEGSFLWRDPEDYTHILHGHAMEKGDRLPSAACGQKVKAEAFINTRANVEPSCKGCAEIWKKEYRGK